MKKSPLAFLTAVVVILLSHISHAALTPQQQSYLDKAQNYLNDASLSYKAYPTDMCGFDIPTKIDPSLAEPFLKADLEVKNYCEEVRTKVALICRDGSAPLQEKVKKNIKSITCRLSSKPEEILVHFANGNLEVSLNTKSSDIDRAVLKYIETSMPGSKAAPVPPPRKK